MSDPTEPLRRIMRRLTRQSDPGDRAATLAELQRATRPALAEAVTEWRESTGAEWSTIAARLGISRPTLHRQLATGTVLVPDTEREERESA